MERTALVRRKARPWLCLHGAGWPASSASLDLGLIGDLGPIGSPKSSDRTAVYVCSFRELVAGSASRAKRSCLCDSPSSVIWPARKLTENAVADEFTFLGVAAGIALVLLMILFV